MTDARTITERLRGRWHGRFGVAFCPAHENVRTPALSLADGRNGQLLAKCHAGCSFRDIAAALRALGIEAGGRLEFDPAAMAKRRAEALAEKTKRRARAARCWAETVPAAGTLGERYLRARGYRGRVPNTLRFDPSCWHESARRFPALVALVELGAIPVGVHRTYLAEPGRKADVDPVKAMLGPVAGGAARLADGAGPLVVAEGIETALALGDALADLSPRVWAGLSAPGVAGLQLPGKPGDLAIAPDGDEAGRTSAKTLARRAWGLGWRVRIMEPPGDGLDWADVVERKVA